MSDTGPVLHQVNLVVTDMEAAVAFYRRLGLTIEDTAPEWDPHHRTVTTPGGLDFDIDSVEFARQWGRWPDRAPGATAVLGLRLPSRERVDEVYADVVAAGYHGQQEPYDAFWGARYAIVQDPDGNPVGLMSEPDPARRSAPSPP